MAAADILKKPEECVMLLVDFQAGARLRRAGLSELLMPISGRVLSLAAGHRRK
jgi:hypothetical protein